MKTKKSIISALALTAVLGASTLGMVYADGLSTDQTTTQSTIECPADGSGTGPQDGTGVGAQNGNRQYRKNGQGNQCGLRNQNGCRLGNQNGRVTNK